MMYTQNLKKSFSIIFLLIICVFSHVQTSNATSLPAATLTTINIGGQQYTLQRKQWHANLAGTEGVGVITPQELDRDLKQELTTNGVVSLFSKIDQLVAKSTDTSLVSTLSIQIITHGHLDLDTLTTKSTSQGVFNYKSTIIPKNSGFTAHCIPSTILDGSFVQSIDSIQGYWTPKLPQQHGNTVDIIMTLKTGIVGQLKTEAVALFHDKGTTQTFYTNKVKLTLLVTNDGYSPGKVMVNTIHPIKNSAFLMPIP